MFGQRNVRRLAVHRNRTTVWLLVLSASLSAPGFSAAQSVSDAERDAIVRLRVERGGRAEDVEPLIRVANEALSRGLPAGPLTNKIREGLAKNVDPKRIEVVVRQMAANLDAADRLMRELEPGLEASAREVPLTLLAESFGGGVSPDEVRDLRRQSQTSDKAAMPPVALASAAKGLSFIKEARLPAADGAAVIVEAGRQGFRPHEILDVGREVKRREADYRAGRATLGALRDAIARGERPDQLFRGARPNPAPDRPAAVERPAAGRPEAPARPERPAPVEPQRPEPPSRPQRPEVPDRPGAASNR